VLRLLFFFLLITLSGLPVENICVGEHTYANISGASAQLVQAAGKAMDDASKEEGLICARAQQRRQSRCIGVLLQQSRERRAARSPKHLQRRRHGLRICVSLARRVRARLPLPQ
jgi:hypothetical protein